jgi:metallo-beta-lactamase family protein
VKCHISSISALSAHGDQLEMVDWLSHFTKRPKEIFINHGEHHQADALRVKINYVLGWEAKIPKMNTEYILPY